MAAGLKIYNTSGTILIDDTYRNLAVSSSGTTSADGNGNIDLGAQPAEAMIAVRATSAVTCVGNRYLKTAAGTSVQWWVFSHPTAVGTAGLKLWTSAGALTFDSSRQYGRVVADHTQTMSSNVATTYSAAYPSGRTYAAVIRLPGTRFVAIAQDPGSPDPGDWYGRVHHVGAAWSGTTLTLQWVQVLQAFYVTQPTEYSDLAAAVLVVEVTGY